MGSSKGSEGTYSSAKLKGIENYKEWAREMGFALLDVGLMAYANGTSSKPMPYTEIMKPPKEGSAPLTEKKIEKREAELRNGFLTTHAPVERLGGCVLGLYNSS